MAAIPPITVNIIANLEQFNAAITQAEAKVKTFSTTVAASTVPATKAIDAMGNSMVSMGRTMSQIGGRLTSIITVPMGIAAFAASKYALETTKALSQVSTVSDYTYSQVQGWQQQLIETSNKYAVSMVEVANGLEVLGSAGVPASQAMTALDQNMKAVAIGLGSSRDVLNVTTSILAGFHYQAITSAEALDTLTKGAQVGKFQINTLANSLGQVIPFAEILKMKFSDVTGAFAAMSRTMPSAAQAGTALRSMFESLIHPVGTTVTGFERLGWSAHAMIDEIRQKGLLTALNDLNQRLKDHGMSAADVFGKQRSLTAMFTLMGLKASELKGIFEQTGTSMGSLQKAFENMQKSPAFQFDQALTKMKNALLPFGVALLQVASNVMNFLTPLINFFTSLPGPVKNFLGVLAGLIGIAGPLLIFFGSLTSAIGLLKMQLSGMGPVIAGFIAKLAEMRVAYTAEGAIAALRLGLLALGSASTIAMGALGAVILVLQLISSYNATKDEWANKFASSLDMVTGKVTAQTAAIAKGAVEQSSSASTLEKMGFSSEQAAKAITGTKGQYEAFAATVAAKSKQMEGDNGRLGATYVDGVEALNDIRTAYEKGMQTGKDNAAEMKRQQDAAAAAANKLIGVNDHLGETYKKQKVQLYEIAPALINIADVATVQMGRVKDVTQATMDGIKGTIDSTLGVFKSQMDGFISYAKGFFDKMVGYLDLGKAFGDANDAKQRLKDAQDALTQAQADYNESVSSAQDKYNDTIAKKQKELASQVETAQKKVAKAQAAALADQTGNAETAASIQAQIQRKQMDLEMSTQIIRDQLAARHFSSQLLYNMAYQTMQDQIAKKTADANDSIAALQDRLASISAGADPVAEAQANLAQVQTDGATALADAQQQAKETLDSVVYSANKSLASAQTAVSKAGAEAGISWVDRFKQQMTDVTNWLNVQELLKGKGVDQHLIDTLGAMGPRAGAEYGTQLLGDTGLLGTLMSQYHTVTEGIAQTANDLYTAAGDEQGGYLGTATGKATVKSLTKWLTDKADEVKKLIQTKYKTTITIDVQYNIPDLRLPDGAVLGGTNIRPATSSATGGWINQRGGVLMHAGEFVLSRQMLSGAAPVPTDVAKAITNQTSNNSNITINAVTNADPATIAREMAWQMKVGASL